MYKLKNDKAIIRTTDNACIPKDQKNRDYKEYLAWLDAGNTPEPADPEPVDPYDVLRERAYKAEADSLFFQEQRGEVPAGTWQAKVDEIKTLYPKP